MQSRERGLSARVSDLNVMPRKDKRWITIVAVCCMATGLFELCWLGLDYRSVWFGVRSILAGEIPLFPWVFLLGFPILSLAKVVSGVGLARAQKCAWWAAVVALSADFLTRLYGHLAAWSSAFLHAQPPPVATGGEGVVVTTVSMWPSSIIAVVSLVSVAILLRGTTRRYFGEMRANEAMA